VAAGAPLDLRVFSRIVFFTGAGLSAESGIPTYRGAGGVWRRYNYEDYACQRAFDRDPARVWDFHEKRREAIARCEPNAAHRLIAAIQAARPGSTVVTQNIDGLHQRAGSTEVVELHGSLWRLRCEAEGRRFADLSMPLASRRCACGAWLRPDVVWFEDPLEADVVERAIRAIEACDCLVSVGTSALVYPAAELPVIAMRAGATTVEINPEETPLSPYYEQRLRGAATAMLPALWPEGEAANPA
jgi:NAD-dependent deacetylase